MIVAGQESGCDVFGDGWQIVVQIRVGEDIVHKGGEAIPPGGGAKSRSGLGQRRSPGQPPGLKGWRLRRGAGLRAEPMFARGVVSGESGHQGCGTVDVGNPRGQGREAIRGGDGGLHGGSDEDPEEQERISAGGDVLSSIKC
jgi:hypothetical protein